MKKDNNNINIEGEGKNIKKPVPEHEEKISMSETDAEVSDDTDIDTVDDELDTEDEPVLSSMSAVKTAALAFVAALAVFVAALGIYIMVTGTDKGVNGIVSVAEQNLSSDDILELNMFYPVPGKVAFERRAVPRPEGQLAIASAVMHEFFRGPTVSEVSYVPDAVEVLNIYFGPRGTIYIDMPSAISLNFKGDAMAEFLLLRAMYKTLRANVPDVRRYRLLVDGQQVDTIGGHIYIANGLERAVAYKLLEEDEIAE